MIADIDRLFDFHENWLVDVFFRQQLLPAMMKMSHQMIAVMMEQAFAIGSFLDAKHQLETQRLFQELQAEAHKDYQPSEDFCWFGTNVRSLAASERAGQVSALALNAHQMDRHLGKVNSAAALGRDADKAARWRQFTQEYCDPRDNNRTNTGGTGLSLACGSGASDKQRVNHDIDFTRLIEERRTLDVAFQEPDRTPDEEDVLALSNNLYGHDTLVRQSKQVLKDKGKQELYLALRAVAAKRSVAQNSYDAIVGLKARGTEDGGDRTADFLGAILAELGVPANEVYDIIGTKPSYYAQLELLAKKIYQNPDFYAALYETPAGVKRKSVALNAIEVMLDRAIYESQLRQEMATSVLLSSELHKEFRKANKDLGGTQ